MNEEMKDLVLLRQANVHGHDSNILKVATVDDYKLQAIGARLIKPYPSEKVKMDSGFQKTEKGHAKALKSRGVFLEQKLKGIGLQTLCMKIFRNLSFELLHRVRKKFLEIFRHSFCRK